MLVGVGAGVVVEAGVVVGAGAGGEVVWDVGVVNAGAGVVGGGASH